MRRKLSLLCLLVAWLCANGVVWNAVQVIGWSKMLHDYSRVMPVAEAIKLTFSGEAPCDFCQLAGSAQDATREQLPVSAALGGATEKILFLADCAPIIVIAAPDSAWPGVADDAGLVRAEMVPVPPPRVA